MNLIASAVPPKPLMGDYVRRFITGVFRFLEDIIFVGLGILLAGSGIYLLVTAFSHFIHHLLALSLTGSAVIELIEQFLLVLLVVEILNTVQVSFREHTLAPEPFLLIGLISAVRRILVITAELAEPRNMTENVFRYLMIELGVLTFLVVALVASVMMLRRKPGPSDEAPQRG